MERGRTGSYWIWIMLGPMLWGTAWAEELRFLQLPAYYQSVDVFKEEERPDPLEGFKQTRKQVADLSVRLASKKLGESEFTRDLVSSAIHSFYQTFTPGPSGRIRMKRPISVLDKTANGLLGQEKERVTKWVNQFVPNLPFIGSPLTEIIAGQKLHFSGGVPRHSFSATKPVQLDYQFGEYSFSGGTVLEWAGANMEQLPVFGFQYGDDSERYALQVTGKSARLELETKYLTGNVEYSPEGLKFALNLTF